MSRKMDQRMAMSHNTREPERSRRRQSKASKLRPKPYLLLDAGGTLVFPDQSFLVQHARRRGVELTEMQLFAGYCRLIHALDCQASLQSGRFPTPWAQGYAYALFETLGIVDPATDAAARAFEARHRRKNMWTFTFEWVREALSCLAAQGYRMSVISNSDGRTAQVFNDLDMAQYFEHIFDSKNLKLEKPDPAIFAVALRRMNVSAADVLYIGDIFFVDVLGANRAGLGGIHLDPLDLYAGWPGIHLRDLRDLPHWLGNHYVHSPDLDLFPLENLHYPIPADHGPAALGFKTASRGEPLWQRESHPEPIEGWPAPTSGVLHKPQPVLAS